MGDASGIGRSRLTSLDQEADQALIFARQFGSSAGTLRHWRLTVRFP